MYDKNLDHFKTTLHYFHNFFHFIILKGEAKKMSKINMA